LEPGNINARTDRGTSYWNLGQPKEALREFQKSLEIDGSHPQTLFNIGVVQLHGMNNPVEARLAWERLLELHPAYPQKESVLRHLATLPAASASKSEAPPDSAKPGAVSEMEEFLKRMTVRP
jgi:tetratricopeptide (TPR) repeat protein